MKNNHRLSGVAAAMLGVKQDDRPQWLRRLASLVGHAKVAKPISDDIAAALARIEALEAEVEKLKTPKAE